MRVAGLPYGEGMTRQSRFTSIARTTLWVALGLFSAMTNLIFSTVGAGETTPYLFLSFVAALTVPFTLIWRRSAPGVVLAITLAAGTLLPIGAVPSWIALGSFLRRRPLPFAADRIGWVAVAGVCAVTYLAVHRDLAPAHPHDSLLGFLLDPSNVEDWQSQLPWYTAILTTAILLTAVLGVIALTISRQRLRLASTRIERTTAVNTSLAHEIARYEERERIARELHDSLGSKLAAVSMLSGAIRANPEASTDVTTRAEDLQRTAQEATAEMHEIVRTYRNHPRPDISLQSVSDLINACISQGMAITADINIDDGDVAPDVVNRAVYRVVQELTTNAAKHAPGEPLRLNIHGGREQGGITISASNPIPASSVHAHTSGGSGLIGAAERVEQMGGWIHTWVEAGTFIVQVWVPWRVGPSL